MIRLLLFGLLLALPASAQINGCPPGPCNVGPPCPVFAPPSGDIYDSATLSGSTKVTGADSLTFNTGFSPACSMNAATFTEGTTNAQHQIEISGGEITHTFSGVSVSAWVDVHQGVGSRNAEVVMFNSSFAVDSFMIISPSTCTVVQTAATTFTGGAVVSGTLTTLPNGWCRVKLNTSVVTDSGVYFIPQSTNGTTQTYTGDGVSSLQFANARITSP